MAIGGSGRHRLKVWLVAALKIYHPIYLLWILMGLAWFAIGIGLVKERGPLFDFLYEAGITENAFLFLGWFFVLFSPLWVVVSMLLALSPHVQT